VTTPNRLPQFPMCDRLGIRLPGFFFKLVFCDSGAGRHPEGDYRQSLNAEVLKAVADPEIKANSKSRFYGCAAVHRGVATLTRDSTRQIARVIKGKMGIANDVTPSLPGLTRQSIIQRKSLFEDGWIRGSSPRMTKNVSGARDTISKHGYLRPSWPR